MTYDDGIGGWLGLSGSIDYATGAATVPTVLTKSIATPQWVLWNDEYHFAGWLYQNQGISCDTASTISVEYQYGDALSQQTEIVTGSNLVIDFVEGKDETALLGSLSFGLGNYQFIDQGGAIYTDVSNQTGSGTLMGGLDPTTRRVTLTEWPDGMANSISCFSLKTMLGQVSVSSISFKVPTTPIKPSAFTLYATQLNGTAIQATVNSSGELIATGIVGTVQFAMGIADVRFGDWIDVAGNEGQPWYRADLVQNGKIFRPLPVLASSIRYDATCEDRSALPADIINIETDLLPKTGALECVRARDVIYVYDDQDFSVANPVAGAAIDCGRTGLERIWVEDAQGVEVDPTLYTATAAELDAGICHWADPLTIPNGLVLPFKVYHRISQTRTVGHSDPFGNLRLRDKPFSKAFSAGAKVASVLYAQSLQANWMFAGFYYPWTKVADAGTGNTPAAAYDYSNFPPVVRNNGVTMKTRMFVIMQTASTFRVILEGFQQIDSSVSIASDYSPINPATQQPILTLWGNRSRTVIVGNTAPSGLTGSDGDWYIDAAADLIYGPKEGNWPDGEIIEDAQGVSRACWINVLENYATLLDAVGHSVTFSVEPWGTGWNALDYFIISLDPSSFPIIVGRSVQPSDPVEGLDSGRIEMLGNFG